MKRLWLQLLVLVALALAAATGDSSLDDSRDEPSLQLESGDCPRGICRRNFKDDTSKITERDDLAELTNSYKDDGRRKRRCMSWQCLRRRFLTEEIYSNDGDDGIYDDKRSTNMNGLSSNEDTTTKDKRSTRTNEDLSSIHRVFEDKRTTKKNDKSSKRCLTWFCNDYGKRAEMNLETKRETKSDDKAQCMSWKCLGKRLKERMDLINNPIKRKELKKQQDGSRKCLSWDCRRNMVLKDTTSQSREADADRGFKRVLMRKNFAWVDLDENRLEDEEK